MMLNGYFDVEYNLFRLFLGQNGGGGIMSECPAGTKCVQEYFCDENAIMVNYRVSLTPAQKQKRGQLPVSEFLR